MKIHRVSPGRFIFQLSRREKELLADVLQLYPLVPASHHRLTKAADAQSEENQRLLEESLAEQRAAHRRQVETLLNDPERFQKNARHFLFKLSPVEMEFLLQVLNDVRVGSWLALGEPDEDKPPQFTPENFRYLVAMEVCGAFQSLLLAALGQSESPDWISGDAPP